KKVIVTESVLEAYYDQSCGNGPPPQQASKQADILPGYPPPTKTFVFLVAKCFYPLTKHSSLLILSKHITERLQAKDHESMVQELEKV
ncbi:unnamed protein product, partial [Musa acuminata subsp. burmannicoides]